MLSGHIIGHHHFLLMQGPGPGPASKAMLRISRSEDELRRSLVEASLSSDMYCCDRQPVGRDDGCCEEGNCGVGDSGVQGTCPGCPALASPCEEH